MLYELMRECRNFFPVRGAEICGSIEIADGCVSLLHLLPGQYYIVEGSVMNDGLHQEGDALTDETFSGRVIPLAIPIAFRELSERVEEWVEKYGDVSPIVSESFGGYSYSKTISKSGGQTTWKDAFATDLAIWRRL